MNIVKEQIDDLNAVLKVKVSPADYESKVQVTLKDYQKKVNMPGFRPGKVPSGLVKKMYGKAILVDEINKLLNDSIHNYIRDSQLDVLGSPLPRRDDEEKIDWDTQRDFEFAYELGLSPQFSVDISPKEKYDYYVIKVDEPLIDKYVDDITRRYGSVAQAEVSEPTDFLTGDFVELDAAGGIVPGGIFKTSSVFLERVNDAEGKQSLTGVKKDDKIVVDVYKLSENATDRGAMLGIDKTKAESVTAKFQFTVKSITRLKPSELNQDLFDKVYGKDIVKSVEEFRGKLKEELSSMFVNDSDRRLYNDIVDSLMKKVNITLPNGFLKKWLMVANEKPITEEQLEAEYDGYAQGLKWQLIENKIIKDHQIKVLPEEVREYVKELLAQQYAKYGVAPSPEETENGINKVLTNQEEAKKVYERLFGNKVMELFKTTFTLEKKEVSQEEFFKK